MRPRRDESRGTFAGVYDALYDDPAFIAARSDYLCAVLGPPDRPLLDAGCGTGAQVDALGARGYRVVGLDRDPKMLTVAHMKLPAAPLARGDLRRLPFRNAFAGVLCLESPLAYLLDDEDFGLALQSLRRALLPRGRLILDTFDYTAMLGTSRARPREAAFDAVRVVESHSYDSGTRIWTMRQRFAVTDGEVARQFEVKHRLRLRTPDEYARGLEAAGFAVLEMRPGYPGLPDPRIVVAAKAV
jgi:SAM-dependent methyltransferase